MCSWAARAPSKPLIIHPCLMRYIKGTSVSIRQNSTCTKWHQSGSNNATLAMPHRHRQYVLHWHRQLRITPSLHTVSPAPPPLPAVPRLAETGPVRHPPRAVDGLSGRDNSATGPTAADSESGGLPMRPPPTVTLVSLTLVTLTLSADACH